MAHILKGMPYATDYLLCQDGRDFSKGTFNHTELHNDSVRLQASPHTHHLFKHGDYVSAPIKCPFQFNEILPSWNITMFPECGFRIDLRVSNDARAWSPWLYLGSEGIFPEGSNEKKIRSHGDIKVDIDYIIMESTARYCQYRVIMHSATGATSPTLEAFSLSFTNSTGDKNLWEIHMRLEDVPTSTIICSDLPVPYLSQLDVRENISNTVCCPTCVAMILAYYGRSVSLHEAIEANFDPEYKLWGIWPKTSQTLWRYGLRSHIRRFRNFHQVSDILKSGIPVIASIQVAKGELLSAPYYSESSGHIIVIRGIAKNSNILVNDPFARNAEEGSRPYSREEIQKIWLDKGGVGIIAYPK